MRRRPTRRRSHQTPAVHRPAGQVGALGFEPRTSCAQGRRADRAALRPVHALDRSRTDDLGLRRSALDPAELRGLVKAKACGGVRTRDLHVGNVALWPTELRMRIRRSKVRSSRKPLLIQPRRIMLPVVGKDRSSVLRWTHSASGGARNRPCVRLTIRKRDDRRAPAEIRTRNPSITSRVLCR